MTKYCEFCEDREAKDVETVRGIKTRREYFMCVSCIKKLEIERLSRELNEIFEYVPGVVDQTKKAAEFNFRTGRARPRFLNAEDLR